MIIVTCLHLIVRESFRRAGEEEKHSEYGCGRECGVDGRREWVALGGTSRRRRSEEWPDRGRSWTLRELMLHCDGLAHATISSTPYRRRLLPHCTRLGLLGTVPHASV